jgi:hypothetical protein
VTDLSVLAAASALTAATMLAPATATAQYWGPYGYAPSPDSYPYVLSTQSPSCYAAGGIHAGTAPGKCGAAGPVLVSLR